MILKSLKQIEKVAYSIVEILCQRGFIALYAGGCVRDMLLSQEPNDYDIATDAKPLDVSRIFSHTVPVGIEFGVILVIQDGVSVQVATFRDDGKYLDGRHPENISWSTPKEDALRRDFTINGLFFDPIEKKIFDFVDGKIDIHNRIVRAIGDPLHRFLEDKLRLLRTVRFATTLNFSIHEKTWSALMNLSSTIHLVSPERIQQELIRIFLSCNRLRGFDLLNESQLLKFIVPELERLKGCDQPEQFHPEGNVFVHTRLMISLLPQNVSLELILAVLFHDIGKPDTRLVDETGRIRFNGHEVIGSKIAKNILGRLRFPHAIIDAVCSIIHFHMSFKDVQKMRLSTLKKMLARSNFDEELELHRVDCLASHGQLDNYYFLINTQEKLGKKIIIPPPLICGFDLINLGLKPSKIFSEILSLVEIEQLEGRLKNSEEAKTWVLQWIKSHNLSDETQAIN